MAITEESILERLHQVRDPELLVNIVDLGLVYEVAVTEASGRHDIHVKMTMTTPACPAGPEILRDARETLEGFGDEVGKVTVELVMSPPWTPDRMTEAARDELGLY